MGGNTSSSRACCHPADGCRVSMQLLIQWQILGQVDFARSPYSWFRGADPGVSWSFQDSIQLLIQWRILGPGGLCQDSIQLLIQWRILGPGGLCQDSIQLLIQWQMLGQVVFARTPYSWFRGADPGARWSLPGLHTASDSVADPGTRWSLPGLHTASDSVADPGARLSLPGLHTASDSVADPGTRWSLPGLHTADSMADPGTRWSLPGLHTADLGGQILGPAGLCQDSIQLLIQWQILGPSSLQQGVLEGWGWGRGYFCCTRQQSLSETVHVVGLLIEDCLFP